MMSVVLCYLITPLSPGRERDGVRGTERKRQRCRGEEGKHIGERESRKGENEASLILAHFPSM